MKPRTFDVKRETCYHGQSLISRPFAVRVALSRALSWKHGKRGLDSHLPCLTFLIIALLSASLRRPGSVGSLATHDAALHRRL
jgi:hypothetical protein